MNFGSKVAVVLLLLAVVLCPLAACAMSTGQTGQASHPCCPSGKSHDAPAHSDCKCIAAQPSGAQFAFTSGFTPLADVATTAIANPAVAASGHALVFLPLPLSDQDSFVSVHQFRI